MTYTEHQKKLITSSGWRSLISTASKLIIFGHYFLIRIKKKKKIFLLQKGENMVWSRNVIFRKSQKLLTERALSELHGGGLFIKVKSYSFNFNGGLRKHSVGYCLLQTPGPSQASNFCDVWKLTSCDFIPFISSLIELNFCFFTFAY